MHASLAGQVRIRAVGPEMAPRVFDLESACFPQPWSQEQLRQGLESGVLKVVAAMTEETGPLVGYLSYYMVADEAEIVNLAVAPPWRRQGLGRSILGVVLQKWHEAGINAAYLEVRAGNAAARALYSSVGFLPAGVRRKYYPDTGEDAILMRLPLLPEHPVGHKP